MNKYFLALLFYLVVGPTYDKKFLVKVFNYGLYLIRATIWVSSISFPPTKFSSFKNTYVFETVQMENEWTSVDNFKLNWLPNNWFNGIFIDWLTTDFYEYEIHEVNIIALESMFTMNRRNRRNREEKRNSPT